MQTNIHLLICGAGNQEDEILQAIKSSDVVIARDSIALHWLNNLEIKNIVCFSLKDHQTVDEWVKQQLPSKSSGIKVTYVTPFTPVYSDQVALSLVKKIGKERTQVVSGRDYAVDTFQSLIGNGAQTVVTIDGLSLVNKHHPPFSADDTVLIYAPGKLSEVQALLSTLYPKRHEVKAYYAEPGGDLLWHQLELESLTSIGSPVSILLIPPSSADSSLESFQEVIAHLRAPEDGCPWDKKQTHSSLRTYLLEETYEALDALDKNDTTGLKEELGDILLQILLHAQIAAETGEFTMAEVISSINRKIVYRHPHVFKDWVVNGETEVIQNWESLKEKERVKNGDENKKGMLDGVPKSFPALAQAQAIQDRAARVGFDWPDIAPVMDKVLEELEEVKSAPTDAERAKELGDLLFAIVNLIRWYKVDSESALRLTNLKFRKRFAYIEEQARLGGKEMQKMTLAEMDEFWEQAKEFDD